MINPDEVALARVRSRYFNLRDECGGEKYKTILTNGCFDILHAGHIEFFNFLKDQFGEYCLWVGINSDSSIRKLKGGFRPIIPEEQRVFAIKSLCPKAEPFVFTRTLVPFIKEIFPNIYIKGPDYSIEKMDPLEREALQKSKSLISFAPRGAFTNVSTSKIIDKITSSHGTAT